MALQHVGNRLPSGLEGVSACITGSAYVPQLHESAADVPMLLAGRIGDFILSPNIVFSHTTQSAGRLVIV